MTPRNQKIGKWIFHNLALPLIGIAVFLIVWSIISALTWNDVTQRHNLPSISETWNRLEVEIPSGEKTPKHYITQPFAYRGEQDQGILNFAWYSLVRVMKGFLLAIVIAVPIGFLLGSSKLFRGSFDLIIQVLRPVSPLAWLPLMQAFYTGFYRQGYDIDSNEWAAVCTVAVCAMWPTVLNTAAGVRAIPQDYHNVARVLGLSKSKTLFKVLLPSALPHMFTGFRLSLGIAWLVIVAAEMLASKVGIGGFIYNAGYQPGKPEPVIMSILVIGLVGFFLDRIMSFIEAHVLSIAAFPSAIRRFFRSRSTAPVAVPA